MIENIRIEYNPAISENQLWDFYVRNHICEAGFGRERCALPLRSGSHIAAAFLGDKLVGIVRAVFDGLTAVVMDGRPYATTIQDAVIAI